MAVLYAIAGHASSSKSKMQALWGMFKFLLSPHNTTVFLTSTTKDAGKKRIWGRGERILGGLLQVHAVRPPGAPKTDPRDAVESMAKIQFTENGKKGDVAGMFLVPGQQGHEEVADLIGYKNENVILCGDEYPLLSEKLDEAAQTNLLIGNKNVQMLVTGNLGDWNDTMGKFCTPKGGIASISPDGRGMIRTEVDGFVMLGWETDRGFCRWFDGERCPNVVAGEELYRGLLTIEKLDQVRANLAKGITSAWEFYRMVHSFPSPAGKMNACFTSQEIASAGADLRVTTWTESPDPISFLDPSFSHDGDVAAAAFGFCGLARINGRILRVVMVQEIVVLNAGLDRSIDPATGKEKDSNPQIVERYAQELQKRGVKLKNTGVDESGGGAPFCSLLAQKIGVGFCRVQFQGKVSERPISEIDPRPANERYDRLVTELWLTCKELVRSGQLKNIPQQAIAEFCTRTCEEYGRGMVKIQQKKDMKSSPNFADSVVGLCEVARRNFDFDIQLQAPETEDKNDFLSWSESMEIHGTTLVYS